MIELLSDSAILDELNRLLFGQSLPTEAGRRLNQNVDPYNSKALQYRNYFIFLFPLLAKCLDPESSKLIHNMGWFLRGLMMPNPEYWKINQEQLDFQVKNFEQKSEAKFGLGFMNWVEHQLHHAVKCRQSRDLTEC